jgi:malate synthase
LKASLNVARAGLMVSSELAEFIEEEALPGLDLSADAFWTGLAGVLAHFTPENGVLMQRRARLQAQIDAWHRAHAGSGFEQQHYLRMLHETGYLTPSPGPFLIETTDVDREIASVAGPQLVVPALNARFALNAANARWGSLYDALYGTDVLPGAPRSSAYDPVRGAEVIAYAKAFLDRAVPLQRGNWAEFRGGRPDLANSAQLVGERNGSLLLCNNGLHVEVIVDRGHVIGRDDPAGISDIALESALTTIVDLEDSVSAVDAEDKVVGYRNWLGLLRGDLTATFEKDGRRVTRRLAPDRTWTTRQGEPLTLPGRSLLLVRNVGLHMTTPAVLLPDGQEAPEGIVDAVVSALIGLRDVRGPGRFRNSRGGSIYIVKPKLHGPDECVFTDQLFNAVEDMLGLSRHTIKIGLMDEERRTSANLMSCIHALRHRIFFINTGFLDRTGDEIHTGMQAGAMIAKSAMKTSGWLAAYETRNVAIGLACGFAGRAQIGKGMWAAPNRMAEMLDLKLAHPRAGASTAWVPSPTAATIHALHYHEVDVFSRQREIASEPERPLAQLLTIPVAPRDSLNRDVVRDELDNNVQGILGYVVRWIDQGIGCSTVPDINDIGLMEDRATLRISSQHLANWLTHGVVSPTEVDAAFDRLAPKVDAQNADDPHYIPLHRGSLAFEAARALIFEGANQPNGYTEALLHAYRQKKKSASLPAGK